MRYSNAFLSYGGVEMDRTSSRKTKDTLFSRLGTRKKEKSLRRSILSYVRGYR